MPAADWRVDKLSTWRNYRVARTTVYPFQFNPSKRRVSAARRVTLRVSFLDTQPGPDDTIETPENLKNAGAYSTSLVNHSETHRTASPTNDPNRVHCLIIAYDPLVHALKTLIHLKAAQGYPTEVLKLGSIGAEPWRIEDEIVNENNASAIEYVLLVGSVNDLPFFTYELPWTSFYKEDILGNYWYSLLDGWLSKTCTLKFLRVE